MDDYTSVKRVRIAVTVKNGVLTCFNGNPLPQIKHGAIGDLVMPLWSIRDPKFRKALSSNMTVQLLPFGTNLLFGLKIRQLELQKQAYLKNVKTVFGISHIGAFTSFPAAFLQEPLMLDFRGTNPPSLRSCACRVDYLGEELSSVNHCYTRLSEVFEPHRISHTGNIFRLVFYKDQNGNWYNLQRLRDRAEAQFEKEVFGVCDSTPEFDISL